MQDTLQANNWMSLFSDLLMEFGLQGVIAALDAGLFKCLAPEHRYA